MMASSIVNFYDYIIYEKMDKRVQGWFLMDSPLYVGLILVSYLLFVTKIGPWWMKGRPPYNVEKAMLLYNIVQISANASFVYNAFKYIWIPGHYKLTCQTPIYEPSPTEDIVVFYFYLFMCSRILDLFDTVFMVLKKNKHQISFLHTYHHVGMALGCWICVKYFPGGHVSFLGTVNSFVHVVMYFYYFLTSVDPSYKKSIWWKRHITHLQLAQFFILSVQQFYGIMSPSCEYPKFILVFLLIQAVLMIYLFAKFYNNAYLKKKTV